MAGAVRIGETRVDLLFDGVFEAPKETLSHRRGGHILGRVSPEGSGFRVAAL